MFDNDTINMLEKKITKLKGDILELKKENKMLKENQALNDYTPSNAIKLFALFGFTDSPNTKDLKARYRRIQRIVHSDKGGDDKLSQLFNDAYNALLKS